MLTSALTSFTSAPFVRGGSGLGSTLGAMIPSVGISASPFTGSLGGGAGSLGTLFTSLTGFAGDLATSTTLWGAGGDGVR